MKERFSMKKFLTEKTENSPSQPGFWETLRRHILGNQSRLFDCVQVEVSTRCIGRCDYCPHTTARDSWCERDMDFDTFVRLSPVLQKSARLHLQGWGEPMLNPRFFEMAALGRQAGCAVSTTTSGLLIDKESALKIVETGLDIVAFSLAGTDPQTNSCRKGIDFERVCQAVSLLQATRQSLGSTYPEIHIAYLMLASRMEAVRGLPALMHELGVQTAVISTLDYVPTEAMQKESFTLQETAKLAAALKILEQTEHEAKRFGLNLHWNLPNPKTSGRSCLENINRSFFVAADGTVSPCVYLNPPGGANDPKRRTFGNIIEQNPLNIWNSEAFRTFRRNLADGQPDPVCFSCIKRFET